MRDVIGYISCRLYSEGSVQSIGRFCSKHRKVLFKAVRVEHNLTSGRQVTDYRRKRTCRVDLQGSGVIPLGFLRPFRCMLHLPLKRQESVTFAMGKVNTKELESQHRCCGNVSNSETVRNLSDTSKRSNGAK